MCIWYDVGIRLFYIIAMILSNYCIYHDDVKTIVLHAYCKYTTVFRTGLQGRTVCNWLVIPCINIFEKKKKKSNGNIFRVTGLLCREFTGHRWIPLTKASDVELWCSLSSGLKQSRCWWFETPSCSSWRHCNATWVTRQLLGWFTPSRGPMEYI